MARRRASWVLGIIVLLQAGAASAGQLLNEVIEIARPEGGTDVEIVFRQPVDAIGRFAATDERTWVIGFKTTDAAQRFDFEELSFDEDGARIRRVSIKPQADGYELSVRFAEAVWLHTRSQLSRNRLSATRFTPRQHRELVDGFDDRTDAKQYAIDLGPAPDVLDTTLLPKKYASRYVTYVTPDDRLRMGFFATGAKAFAVMREFRDTYPDAEVIASRGGERRFAEALAVYGLPTDESEQAPAPSPPASPQIAMAAVTLDDIDALDAKPTQEEAAEWKEELDAGLMSEGEAAFKAGDFRKAVAVYTEASMHPKLRKEALEMLAVSRESNGQLAHAKALYEQYLTEFATDPDAERVQLRLAALVSPRVERDRVDALAPPRPDVEWNVVGNVSQFYHHHEIDIADRGPVDAIDAVFSDVNVIARRRTANSSQQARVSIGHFLDMLDQRDDRSVRTHQLYVESQWEDPGIGFAVGRQSLRKAGIPGRFDGARLSYRVNDNIEVAAVGGYVVESSFDSANMDRPVMGTYANLSYFDGNFEVVPFVMQQELDGVLDRRAVGFQTHFFNPRVVAFAGMDYDVHHQALNNAFATTHVPIGDRLRITGSYDFRRSPYLTTRNALIGQPYETLSELEQALVDLSLEELAADRTAESTMLRLGADGRLGDTWSYSVNYTHSAFSSTKTSANVVGFGARQQSYFMAQLRANEMLGTDTYSDVQLRYSESDDYTTTSVMLNTRFAIGDRLRVYPRVKFDNRKSVSGNDQVSVAPSLRIDYRLRDRINFEFETGYDQTTRETTSGDFEIRGFFVRFGYRATLYR